MEEYYKEVVDYFNHKAEDYDDVDQQLYWVLSDAFLKAVLKKELSGLFANGGNKKILDAGAGTGRWTMAIEELFGDKITNGVLVDISPKMLNVAQKKLDKAQLSKKYKCVIGNLENVDYIDEIDFDLAISFYNVLSFVKNPTRAIRQVAYHLKGGGLYASVVANKYHAYYFSILTNRLNQLKSIASDSLIKFNDTMPAIHCFTPEEIKNLFLENGFKKASVYGGLNFIYPGMEETKIHGNTEQIINKLSDESSFKDILSIELDHYTDPSIVGRGNVLLIIAEK